MTFTSGPKNPYPPSLSSAAIFGQWAECQPDAIALFTPGRAPLTYGRLWSEIRRLGRQLNDIGLGREDRVAVVMPDGPEMLVAFLGVSASATFAPLNPAYRPAEFHSYFGELQPRAVIVPAGRDTPARDVARALGIPVLEAHADIDGPAGVFDLEGSTPWTATATGLAEPEDVALAMQTGGTTSRPKLVPLTQKNLWAWAHDTAAAVDLRPDDRCLNMMPLFHVHGLMPATLATLATGGSVARPSSFDATQFWGWLETLNPTWYTAVPAMHQAILDAAPPLECRSTRPPLRFVRSGSAGMPPAILQALEELFRAPVVETYGVTEAGQVAHGRLPPDERRPGTVGRPAGPDIAILDEYGQEVPPGEAGEIVVRGPSVIAGYASPPEANQQAFMDGWFRTGDQGRMSADGFLTLTGRLKDIINRGGEKIAPAEVEQALQRHPAVVEAIVFAVPHPRLGEDVAAAVVVRPGQLATAEELRGLARRHLADFKVPCRIVVVDEIPRNDLGKIQRHTLADKLGLNRTGPANSPRDREVVAPRTRLEAQVLQVWEVVLKVKPVGVTDDFFNLGGDSLLAVQMFGLLEKKLGIRLPAGTLFQGATVERLARILGQPNRLPESTVVGIQTHGSRPPLFVVHGVGGEVLFLSKVAPHLDPDQPLFGLQAPDLTGQSERFQTVEELAARYVADMRKVQPHGPYYVGGYSLGGTIAYEMAQQLGAAGESVGLLALIDNVPPEGVERFSYAKPRHAVRFLHNALRWLRYDLGRTRPRDMASRFRVKLRSWRRRFRPTTVDGPTSHHRPEDFLDLSSTPADFRALLEHLFDIYTRYRPRSYSGRVALFRAQAQAIFSRHRLLPDMGLSRLVAQGIAVHAIPGTHDSILREPHVRVLARALQAALDEAQHEAGRYRRMRAVPSTTPSALSDFPLSVHP